VQQSTRRSVNQAIDPIRRSLSSVEHVEIGVWHEAKLEHGRKPNGTKSPRVSSIPCRGLPLLRAPFGSPRRLATRALRHFAPFGNSRRLATRAVWQLEPFGNSRLSAVRAVWQLAPFGNSRRSATRAVRQLAPFGNSRRSAVPAILMNSSN
jgi:hypothetical protein